MGILRTDKISGLETPTAVTGSVEFDGTGDRLTLNNSNFVFGTSDFTVELFVYKPNTDQELFFSQLSNSATGRDGIALGYQSAKFWILQGNGSSWDLETTVGSFPTGRWVHFAVSRDYSATKTYYFIDGQLVYTYETNVDLTAANSGDIVIGNAGTTTDTYSFTGHISNLRVLKGTALYTSEFTPPVHELEVIGDTVLLCCNNPDSAGAEGTGKTITVNGDAAASTFSPGLTRDFTSGTEFRGVTTFDTQGYFVPPSGTTTERFPDFGAVDAASARGVFGGGRAPSYLNTIDYVTISTTGNAQDFGDLTQARGYIASSSSRTRGVFNAGATPGAVNTQDFITISSTGDALDFGEVQTARYGAGNASSSTRGVFGGGNNPSNTNVIEFITIATTGSTQDFGDLTEARVYVGGCSSSTRGVFGGGSPEPGLNTIDYITISSTGNATNFGDLTQGGGGVTGCSSRTRGLFAGRISGSDPYTYHNIIDYITIAALGNATDFGDLTVGAYYAAGCSSSILGVFGGLNTGGGSYTNTIDYVTISTIGNAADFGDLSAVRGVAAAVSNGHGGLS